MKAWIAVLTVAGLTSTAVAQVPLMPSELGLEEALEMALAFNPAIRQAEAQSYTATQQVSEVLSSRRPRLSALGDAIYDENDTGFDMGPGNERWNAELRVDVPVTSGGRFTARRDVAEAAAMAADEALQSMRSETVRSVSEAYLSAVFAGRVVSVQTESLGVLKQQYENSQSRYDAGILPRLPLLQAQVAYENAKPALLRAEQEQRLALDALRARMGLDYAAGQGPDDVAVQKEWPDIKAPAGSLDEVLVQAGKARPELNALDFELLSARAAERFENRSHMPDLDSFFRYGVDNNTFEEGKDMRSGWTIGLVLNWTLIDLGDRKSRVNQARSRYNELQYRKQATWLQIEQQLREAWYAREVSEAILTSAQVNVAQAEEALLLSTESMNNGRATQLDVLQAELALTRAKLEKQRAEHDRLVATVRLVFAVGSH